MTNCNHKQGLMSSCEDDVESDMFTYRAALFYPLPKRAPVDWNWPI